MESRRLKEFPVMATSVRPYRPEDAPALLAMLKAEGIRREETTFASGASFLLSGEDEILGFFSLDFSGLYPRLKHFCIARDHRFAQSNAWKLIGAARETVRMAGYGEMIVHGRGNHMVRF
ncbi:hypothetical protein LCGC14_2541490, partial [marine sediment metagenome]